jgi:predicted nucleotidyltransferase
MARKGFRSVEQLANSLGLHRNTIGNYLQGSPALPEALSRILDILELPPELAFQGSSVRVKIPALAIASLVDKLNAASPASAIVLFGSRARGNHKKFSDYDLGIFRTTGIPFSEFSPLLSMVNDFNANNLQVVQLSNLAFADTDFLTNIREDLVFLGGSFVGWVELLRRAGITIYE